MLRLARAVRDLPQPGPAAKLFGAAEAILLDFTERMSASEREFVEATLAEARAQADTAAWANGQSLSTEKMVAWILEQSFLTG